jgi:hypothetical protein
MLHNINSTHLSNIDDSANSIGTPKVKISEANGRINLSILPENSNYSGTSVSLDSNEALCILKSIDEALEKIWIRDSDKILPFNSEKFI